MPKIPDLFVPSVSENPVRLQQQQLQPITPFQATFTPQLQQLGQAVESAGTGLSRAYDVILDDENDAIAKDLDLQLKLKLDQELEDPDVGFFMKSGPQAGSKAYNEVVNKAYKMLDDSLLEFNDGNKYGNSSYNVAKGMYKTVAMQRIDAFKSRAAEHARSQIRDYADKMSEARWMMHTDDAAKFRTEFDKMPVNGQPTNFQKAIIAARTEAQTIASRKVGDDPKDKDLRDYAFKQRMGQTHAAVMTNFLDGKSPDIASATKYLEANGYEMLEQDREKLKAVIQDRKPIAEGFTMYREVLANKDLKTLAEQRSYLDQVVEKDPTKQLAADHAFDRLKEYDRVSKDNANTERANTYTEFVKFAADNNVNGKNFELFQRENPQWTTRLEQHGLIDNVRVHLNLISSNGITETGRAYINRSGAELADEFDTEEQLRKTLVAEMRQQDVDAAARRWGAFSRRASQEQRSEGNRHTSLYDAADLSLKHQGFWDLDLAKDEATKKQMITDFLKTAEDRARAKTPNSSEDDVIKEMELMEKNTFKAIDDGGFWSAETINKISAFTMVTDLAREVPKYEEYRFQDGSKVTTAELKKPVTQLTIGTSVADYDTLYEAINAYVKYANNKTSARYDLGKEEDFLDAYKAVKQLQKGK